LFFSGAVDPRPAWRVHHKAKSPVPAIRKWARLPKAKDPAAAVYGKRRRMCTISGRFPMRMGGPQVPTPEDT